ncbi:hypothetical protein SBV1_gp30 [Sulfolobales Beppu virus 1]|nr:hypothetical protein SBV1_gp30 [Sulfolobales Beppu virus 1]
MKKSEIGIGIGVLIIIIVIALYLQRKTSTTTTSPITVSSTPITTSSVPTATSSPPPPTTSTSTPPPTTTSSPPPPTTSSSVSCPSPNSVVGFTIDNIYTNGGYGTPIKVCYTNPQGESVCTWIGIGQSATIWALVGTEVQVYVCGNLVCSWTACITAGACNISNNCLVPEGQFPGNCSYFGMMTLYGNGSYPGCSFGYYDILGIVVCEPCLQYFCTGQCKIP